MATEILSKPKFVIPHREPEEWGEFFCQTAARILAQHGGNSPGRAVENAIRLAAALTESLQELDV